MSKSIDNRTNSALKFLDNNDISGFIGVLDKAQDLLKNMKKTLENAKNLNKVLENNKNILNETSIEKKVNENTKLTAALGSISSHVENSNERKKSFTESFNNKDINKENSNKKQTNLSRR